MAETQTTPEEKREPARGARDTVATPSGSDAGSPKDESKNEEAPKKKPIIWIVLAVAVILGLFFGIRAWSWGRTHVGTDDAYVTGDLVNIGAAIQ